MTLLQRRSSIAVFALIAVVLVATSAQGVAEVPVVTTQPDQQLPAASLDHEAWTEWRGSAWAVFVREGDGDPVRVSEKGVNGSLGGIDGTTLVYQQYSGTSSDIYTFDLVSHERTMVAPPVSTTEWEYRPSIAGDHILFARALFPNRTRVLLYDVKSGTMTRIASTEGENLMLVPGQVSGDWVVYERRASDVEGNAVACDVFRYRISTAEASKLRNPRSRCQFGPSVNPQGTVYFGRSGFVCGRNVSIVSKPVGEPATSLIAFEAGQMLTDTYAVDRGSGSTDVYFDRSACNGPGDIYRVAHG